MNSIDTSDPVFRAAVTAIDGGDLSGLQKILTDHRDLVAKRLSAPAEGYFKHPYLLWFVADNPIRQQQLPSNIVAITDLLIETASQYAADSFQLQIDYTLGLVATGRVPRDCGVQIALMDLLLNAGAKPGTALDALAHGNIEAAEHLLSKGAELTLATAAGMGRENDAKRLLQNATPQELDLALVVAAFSGNTAILQLLMDAGANVNAYPSSESGFHVHATALHQAVSAGSIDAVAMLVRAGADREAKDKLYDGTPLDWALHLQKETTDTGKIKKYAAIENILRSAGQ